jgi:hypothetical protein
LHHDVPLGRLAVPLLTLFLFLELWLVWMMTDPLHHDVPLGRLAVPLLTLFLFLEVELVGMMNSQKMMTILELTLVVYKYDDVVIDQQVVEQSLEL